MCHPVCDGRLDPLQIFAAEWTADVATFLRTWTDGPEKANWPKETELSRRRPPPPRLSTFALRVWRPRRRDRGLARASVSPHRRDGVRQLGEPCDALYIER